MGKNSDLNDEIIKKDSVKKPTEEDVVDLGSDDDYIYVDHSNDEISEEFEEPTKPNIEDYVTKEDVDYNHEEVIIANETHQNDSVNVDNIKKPVFSDKVNISADEISNEEEINADSQEIEDNIMSDDEEIVSEDNFESEDNKVDLGSDDYNDGEEIVSEDKVDLGSDDYNDGEEIVSEDKVDLGSDDDYIYVDHSNDEIVEETEEGNFEDEIIDEPPQNEIKIKNNHRKSNYVKSIISDVVSGEPRLKPEEIETVRGEVIEEDNIHFSKPTPKDENVVEAEIINGDDYSETLEKPTPKGENVVEAEIINGDDFSETLEKPTPKDDYLEEDEELNIFTDELPDLTHDEYDKIHEIATNVIDKAMDEFMDEVFDNKEFNESFEEKIKDKYVDDEIIENKSDQNINVNEPQVDNDFVEVSTDTGMNDAESDNEIVESFDEFKDNDIIDGEIKENAADENNSDIQDIKETDDSKPIDEVSADEEIIYFKGANDVTNPLRKNNVYYNNEHKNKSIRDSIKGFKNDIKYINKSLNEIENPTQIDYVSVVDRTEEYDPDEYLSRPSDDDSDKIIKMEEELTFAEKEEQRIANELDNIPVEDDVIVTVNNPQVREEVKDQALEEIIQSANEDYKEIEKERGLKMRTN